MPLLPPTRRAALSWIAAAGAAFGGARPAFALSPVPAPPETLGGKRAHGSSLIGGLKYPAEFKRLEFVNPEAPKGGKLRLAVMGGFDSFNPYIPKGDAAGGVGMLTQSLMSGSGDELSTQYGDLAEWIEYAEDYSWSAFRIRPQARWHDGKPITPDDVIFSLDTLKEKGDPFYGQYYKNVEKAEDLGAGVVKFSFKEKGNRELPQIVGELPILPKHWWTAEGRKFEESNLEVPLGSGPYKLARFEAGRFIEYERVADWWAKDLPLNVGRHNFDVIRHEYFKDEGAVFDAFKAGEADFRSENSARSWATAYDFDAVKKGDVIKEEPRFKGPESVQTFVMNQRRAKFADRRVREAVGLMFDFEWTNATLYYNQYARPWSYFQNSEKLMATGLPTGRELEILNEFKDKVPPEVFTQEFSLRKTDASGRDREGLGKARGLLEAAGWTVKDGALVNGKGEPLEIEFLTSQQTQERIIAPYLKNLERLGIKAGLRIIDTAQYVRRVREFDFDMIVGGVGNSISPGNEQRDYWTSEAADKPGSRNVGGVKNPVVDAIVEKLIFAKDRAELEACARALDRVLLWEHYNVLQLYTPFDRIAYWKHLKHGGFGPYGTDFPGAWWMDPAAVKPK